MYYQMLHITGRATADAVPLKSKAGKDYVKVSIAVNFKKNKDADESTNFFDVLIFGKGAEVAIKNVKKGDLMTAFGRPDLSAYMSKKEKAPKPSCSIMAIDWQVLKK